MSRPSFRQIALSALTGGLVLNLIDTPWSVLVMVPPLQAFSQAHGLRGSGLVGPYFLLVHFGYCLAIAWVSSALRPQGGSAVRSALVAGTVLLALNRAFGLGNVFLGLMPLSIFLGFSLSFVVGTLAASGVMGWLLDRQRALRA